jgi:3-dehydroquinate synthase
MIRAVAPGSVALLVTDRIVGKLYGGDLERSLERAGYRVVRTTLPAGERAKSIGSLRALCGHWARIQAGRDAVVVALGGGVVSDVAGFAASTYARGLRWIALPTTLLAQADAAIGGKVGVNLPSGKNLIGAFHHPSAVFADTWTLRTLTPRAYRAGLAEVLKIGVVRRPAILARLSRLVAADLWRDPRAVEPLIRLAAAEKAALVSRDERDQGRAQLRAHGGPRPGGGVGFRAPPSRRGGRTGNGRGVALERPRSRARSHRGPGLGVAPTAVEAPYGVTPRPRPAILERARAGQEAWTDGHPSGIVPGDRSS